MANYPAINQSPETRIEPIASAVIGRSINGAVHGREYHDADQFDIECVHRFISTTDKDSILATYAANKTIAVNWTYSSVGTVYSVYFVQRPTAIRAPDTSQSWHVTSRLTGQISP